jgi:hypothetical protein
VAFLLIELDLAMTFMGSASATTIEEAAQRDCRHALKAYGVVVRLLPKVSGDQAIRC